MKETLIQPGASTIPDTSATELRRILAAQEIETRWWNGVPKMETVQDIQAAVGDGWAVAVPVERLGYKISPGVTENFRILEKNTQTILEEIGKKWIRLLGQRGIDRNEAYLRITSLARTTAYQKKLIKQGYPAAKNSTHTKLGAFEG